MEKITLPVIAFEKMKEVIESCITHEQLIVADNMIDNYCLLYGQDENWEKLTIQWMEKCGNKVHEDFQPCGRAHQQSGNAETQIKELYGC